MKINRMSRSDISEVAGLHMVCLPHTASSKIGLHLICNLYAGLLADSDCLAYVIKDRDRIIGCITATTDLSETMRKQSQNLRNSEYIISLVLGIFSRKIDPKEILKRYLFEKTLVKRLGSKSEILTLFVEQKLRRQGIAGKLISNLEKEFFRKKIYKYFVDTTADNTQSLSFYRKTGFRQFIKFSDYIVLEKSIT
jgi:ribosomal protein S18 acetylase RimI-like enzyme